MSGGAGALTGALKVPFAMQVGTSLITAAKHSVGGISSIYRKQGLEKKAEASVLNAEIDIDKLDIEDGAKMLTHAAEYYELNSLNVIKALAKEIDIYERLVYIQQSGRN